MLALSHHYGKAFNRRRSPAEMNWKDGLEKVLEDPVGLKAFTEFLKREFSSENIMFWVLCEHYNNQSDKHQRKALAKEIVEHHLCPTAPEPINIDSHTRQATIEGATEAAPDLFLPAQKQIFNLMKFDCYQSFLKSDLYETPEKVHRTFFQDNVSKSPKKSRSRSKSRDRSRLLKATKLNLIKLNRENSENVNSSGNSGSEENSPKDEVEEKKRKSLLPWQKGREKNSETERSNSRSPVMRIRSTNFRRSKRKNGEKNMTTNQKDQSSSRTPSDNSDVSESFSNKVLLDEPHNEVVYESSEFCRIRLPDSSSAVLSPETDETLGEVIQNLIAKRGLPEMTLEVHLKDSTEALPLDSNFFRFRGKELVVDNKSIVRLELPLKKDLVIKADPLKKLEEVLELVLKKYGLTVWDMTLQYASTDIPVNLNGKTADAHRCKIIAQKKDVPAKKTTNDVDSREMPNIKRNAASVIFDEVLNGSTNYMFDEHGILDLDNNKQVRLLLPDESDSKSITIRRNSLSVSKGKTVSLLRYSNRSSSIYDGADIKIEVNEISNSKNDQDSRRSLPRNFSQRDSCDITKIWNRVQQRFDDQRGTELNCELPDFLRIKDDSCTAQVVESDL